MPWVDSTNALAAGNESPRYAQGIQIYAATATTLPVVGSICIVKTPYTQSTGGDTNAGPAVVLHAVKCPAAGSKEIVGVCVGGSSLGTDPVAGGMVMVCTTGVATVLFQVTATAGDQCIATTAHAGKGKSAATPTLGKTVGVILQTKDAVTPPVTVGIPVLVRIV